MKINNKKELKRIAEEKSGHLDYKDFLKICNYCTREPYSFMLIDTRYKPNVLDKARFEFFPLGKAFSTRLDKTVQGYQEEGVIKLLKDIRDNLAGGIGPRGPGGPRRPDDNGDDDDDQLRLNKILGTIEESYDDDEWNRIAGLLKNLKNYKTNEERKEEPKEDKLDEFYKDHNNETFQEIINDYLDKINKYKDIINNINEKMTAL